MQDITELEIAYQKLAESHKQSLYYHSRLISSQLNPHFIFNALNSIQYYILNNEQEPALHYLSSFSGLMRQTLDNSRSDYLLLSDEIIFLRNYIELEENRFKDKFVYEIIIDEKIVPQELYVPPMFIQPHVENAIIHGIGNKEGKGFLKVEFSTDEQEQMLICSVKDDGVGREKAKKLRSLRTGVPSHDSVALSLTKKRLDILNELAEFNFDVKIKDLKDKDGNPLGTEVIIRIPYITDV